jgi:hypothetical protein
MSLTDSGGTRDYCSAHPLSMQRTRVTGPSPPANHICICAFTLHFLALQGKGAVGRFFSELTRQGSLSELTRKAELARQPSISAALAAAGMGGAGAGRSGRARASSGGGGGGEAQSSAGFAGGLKQVIKG